MNTVFMIFIFIIGLCIGSFINVCIYRIPREESIAFPASHCTSCEAKIKVIDLIPIFSYIFLRGRCRNCNEKISIKYPVVELLTGLLFLAAYLQFGNVFKLLFSLIFISIFLMIFYIDLEHMIIPDGLNAIIALLGVTFNIVFPIGDYKSTLISMGLGLLAGGGFFLILGLFGAMGGGDIKMMAALGLLFGFELTILLMFLAFVIGGIVSITFLITKVKTMKDMVPFGPYIAMAGILVLFFGTSILNWYMGVLMI